MGAFDAYVTSLISGMIQNAIGLHARCQILYICVRAGCKQRTRCMAVRLPAAAPLLMQQVCSLVVQLLRLVL